MNLDLSPPNPLAVCTTSEAARRLGVSSTTVQVMVERGELKAWRTRGGHRRISLDSVDSVQRQRGVLGARFAPQGAALCVLVVEGEAQATHGETAPGASCVATLRSWEWPLQVLAAGDGLEALLLVERRRPDVVIVDFDLPRLDGVEFVRSLRAHHEFDAVQIIALSEKPASARAAGLAAGVAIYGKPVPYEKLQGFIEALVLRRELATIPALPQRSHGAVSQASGA